jgi:Dolichyl-phosphate-mannose-protein mannosyltransferase
MTSARRPFDGARGRPFDGAQGRLSPVEAWLWAILLIAAALRIFPVWFGLPFLHARPDEPESISRAVGILAGDLNPHFFHWPSLTFYVFAAALGTVSGIRSLAGLEPSLPVDVALITARTSVAIAGTLTGIPLFRLGQRIAGQSAGLLAAGFLAVVPLHVRDSHFAMTDVLMTLLLTASLAALVTAHDDTARVTAAGEAHWQFAVAGLLGGLATSAKYNAAVVVVSMAAAQILLLARPGPGSWAARRWRSLAPAAIFAAAFVGGFVAGTPYAVLDFPAFAADFSYDLTHLSGGHAVPLGRGWYAHVTRSLPYGCGLLLLVAGLAGVGIGARRHPEHTFIVASFAAAYYAVIGSGYTVFFRYVMPLVPIVCLFAAIATKHAVDLLGAGFKTYSVAFAFRRKSNAGRILPAKAGSHLGRSETILVALLMFVAGPSLLRSVRMDLVLARTDTRVIAAQWLGPQLRPEHTLHDAGSDYTRLDLRDRRYHEWRFDPNTQSFGHPEGLTPDWIVIPDSPLRQYASADPGLRRLVAERYEPVYTVRGTTSPNAAGMYDQQDAFFVPFSKLGEVERPGPTVTVYRRVDPGSGRAGSGSPGIR